MRQVINNKWIDSKHISKRKIKSSHKRINYVIKNIKQPYFMQYFLYYFYYMIVLLFNCNILIEQCENTKYMSQCFSHIPYSAI